MGTSLSAFGPLKRTPTEPGRKSAICCRRSIAAVTAKGGCYETDHLFWAEYSGASYLPSTAAPCGFTPAGRPVGVQIVGPQYGDLTCLAFARLLGREFQAFVPPPGYA